MALAVCMTATSCMDDDWDNPTGDIPPYGNNNLEETNVVSIADLKDAYASTLRLANDTARILDDIQIKARVTANDVGGNVYNYVAVDDGTGGMIISVAQGGLWAYLPIGQEILVSLKDLYIGCYNYQPQIGTPYTDSSKRTFPSRMNRTLWQEHFRIIGKADASLVTPFEIDMSKVKDLDYMAEHVDQLIVVKGVELTQADGEATFAPEDAVQGNGVSREINGNSSFVVRTSTYADFAATVMPQGKVDITGVLTRYGTTWQLVMRTADDIKLSE